MPPVTVPVRLAKIIEALVSVTRLGVAAAMPPLPRYSD
jgi:hypothetical protein